MTLIGASRNAWGYLLDTVELEHGAARAESKAAYYMANGTPPGVWAGGGTAALDLEAAGEVTAAQLEQLFGEGAHPHTGASLGRAFHVSSSVDDRVRARVTALPLGLTNAELEEQSNQIRQEEMERPVPQSVAGFEFVFSPPKSVSSWWGLADPTLKDEIRQAHQAAINATIVKLEGDIVRTRTGKDGVTQQHVQGITAALFDHWDSRNGDPQLHTHMLVSNRVQGEDGRWRTIDSRGSLSPAVATAGVLYDSVLMDELSARFGVEWTTQTVLEKPQQYLQWLVDEQRVDTPAAAHQFALNQGVNAGSVHWQIAAVPHALNSAYSTRSAAITVKKDQLIHEWEQKYGKKPNAAQIVRLRQQASLHTRRAKRVQSLRDLTTSWREKARSIVGDSFLFADRVKQSGAERLKDYPLWSFRHDDMTDEAAMDAAELVLSQLSKVRATWGRRNAETEALRTVAGWRFRSATDRDLAAKRIVDLVVSQAIPLTPANPLHTPRRFHTADGENMFHPQARDLFTTREVWDAEERLIKAGRDTSSATVDNELVENTLHTPTGSEGRVLSSDQAAAVHNLLTSGRSVDVLVGPAGAGKTTSLEKLREIWELQHGEGSVRGLAPTARAAGVLAESLGISTENTAKWLHETARGTAKREGFDYRLRAGDLMIVDEASIAGTIALDRLRDQAQIVGAKLLLVGDWAQLAAVDSGGAFGLLASDRDDVAELATLHRFRAEWEGDASKLLRLGKTSGLDPYIDNGRVSWGLDETILDDAVAAWKTDESTLTRHGDATLTSLLIAPTNDMVERLNAIAREWRVTQGDVDATRETPIASGVSSPGDRIVTRQNARTLRTDHDRWVKNNDEWVVVDIDDATGDIIAAAGDETVLLPASYAVDHVQLAYATTAHRSQGRTVDTAHTIVDSSATRETFYVAMTRGKESNRAYVLVDEDAALGDAAASTMTRTWRETLERVVVNRGADTAAHVTHEEETERLQSIRQLAAEYQTLTADQLEGEYLPLLTELELVAPGTPESPYLGPVLANLRRLEQHSADVGEVVQELLERRELGDARDIMAILHYRLAQHLETMPDSTERDRIAGIIEAAPEFADTDFTRALRDREAAIQLRAEYLVDEALRNGDAWISELGEPLPGENEQWRKRAVTVACYRDLYGVSDEAALGRNYAHSHLRQKERAIAAAAIGHSEAPRFTVLTHEPAAVEAPSTDVARMPAL